ncbi:amino acid ABC transporter permease [Mycolicibacterium sp. P1-18]|uniref:amino acid ABC transporter permease n=1 Tax=Mycolicibacterium sp. P1-18 TaxID=2024615 RepID=UPI0011F165CA|nr:amino acid ABC transporter permease [Mycolicibacterium sp. P1-18]KAA0090899.1 amino acid ABC transporter permease [Mycolicibacterium sp. P1-18]
MQFDWQFFWKSLFTPSDAFLDGLALTIGISLVAMVLAILLGLVVALMRRSQYAVVRGCASVYIWVIRGTPLLVQLVIIYTGFAAVGIYQFNDVSLLGLSLKAAVQAAVIGLMVNESAYIAEIIRAGLDSVPKGQFEAAASLGMTPGRLMRWIIVPQSLRVMVPPLGNSFNGMMKTTSVLSVIGVSEMFLVTQSISSATFHTFEIFIVAAVYYLALTTIWTFIQAWIENRLARQLGIQQRVSITSRLLGARRAAANAPLQTEGAR